MKRTCLLFLCFMMVLTISACQMQPASDQQLAEVGTKEEKKPVKEKKKEEKTFTITPEELEQQIQWIKQCYYTPTQVDIKIVVDAGTDGWKYTREYYYHDGVFLFAFIYDGTEEHRLYFKDNHMIRYIDPNHVIYDFGSLDPYKDWEQRALEEALRQVAAEEPEASTDPWIGTWTADNGATIVVHEVTDTSVRLTYSNYTEQGNSMFHTDYEAVFTDSSHTAATANASDSWQYIFTLKEDSIVLSSRYPDQYYYRNKEG